MVFKEPETRKGCFGNFPIKVKQMATITPTKGSPTQSTNNII